MGRNPNHIDKSHKTWYNTNINKGDDTMTKLLNKFAANPSKENAARVMAYSAKHPMAMCLLTPEEFAIYHRAQML